jgi:hypothetical protein
MTTKTLTLIQELYFDICDLSYGYSYQAIGYASKKEFYEECKRKLNEIEMGYVQDVPTTFNLGENV